MSTKALPRFFAAVAALCTLAAAVCGYMGWRWVRPPRHHLSEDLPAGAREVYFPSLDGTRLHAIHLEGRADRATLLICHGYFRSLAEPWQIGKELNQSGYNVLLLDFRASGDSGGRFTTVGYKECWDLLAATHFVRRRFGRSPIGVLGISMGASVAIITSAQSSEIEAVVADSPFSNLEAVMGWKIPDFLPFHRLHPLAWLCIRVGERLSGSRLRDVNPLEHVRPVVPRPLLLIYGERDSYIPPGQREELYSHAAEPKKLWLAPRSDHAQARKDHPEEYMRLVQGWFDRYLSVGSSGSSSDPG